MDTTRVKYTLIATIDDEEEVFNSTYYDLDNLIADSHKASDVVAQYLGEEDGPEPFESQEDVDV